MNEPHTEAKSSLRPTAKEATDAWRTLHKEMQRQNERVLEDAEPDDYWGAIAEIFTPGGYPAPELPILETLALPNDTWLEVGAGAGRIAIPIARHVHSVIALDQSPGMIARLHQEATKAELKRFEILPPQIWPPDEASEAKLPIVDVTLAASVIFFISEVGEFLDALERHARRLCVIVVMDRMPGTPLEALWSELHTEPLAVGPALHELLAVLGSRGRAFELRTVHPPPPKPTTLDETLTQVRRQYLLAKGSEREQQLSELLREYYADDDGQIVMPLSFTMTGIVSWVPPS